MDSSQRHDKAHFLQTTVKAISTVLGLPSCIWLLDEGTKAFQVAAAAELSQEYVNMVTLPLDKMSIATEVFKTGKTIIVENIASEERWRYKTEAIAMGWKAAIVVPLWLKRKIRGILDVYIPEGVTFNVVEKMPIIECFADQISATLRQVQGLETLNEVAGLISVVKEHDSDLFERILQAVQKVLDCKRVSIFLVDKDDDLVLEATSTPRIKRTRFNSGEGLAGYVAQTKKPLLVPDVRKHPHFIPGLSTNVEERSMLLSPLFFQSRCTGVISANIDELNGFDEYDQKLIETLTGQIAIAIHNVRLFQSEQERRKESENLREESEKLREESEKLRKIAQLVDSQMDLGKVAGAVLDELHNIVKYDKASVQLIRGNHRFIIGAKGFSIKDSSPRLLRNVSDDPLIRKIVQGRKVLVLSDINDEPLWEQIPETSSVHSWIGAPLVVGDQVIGLLTIDHPKSGYYTQEDGENVTVFANQVSAAIYRSDFFQLIRNQAQALTELNKLTYRLLSIEETHDNRELLQNIAESAKDVLQADVIELYEYRQNQDTFNLPPISVGERYESSLAQKIYKEDAVFRLVHWEKPLYAENSQAEPILSSPHTTMLKDRSPERFIVREKIRSTAVVPFKVGNESMGLMFASYRTPQTFTREQRELIELFANQAAIAIKNSRLYYYVNRRRKALVEIGKELTAGIRRNKDEVLELIYEQASKMLNMENLSIALYDETTNTVRFALASRNGKRVDIKNEPGWEPRQDGKGKTEWIIRNRKHLLLPTIEEVKEWKFSPIPGHKDPSGRLANSWLGVPMIVGEKVLGVIANYDYGQDNFYNEDDIEILQALADQAAIALENVQLYNSLKESEEKYRTVVEQANDGIFIIQDKVVKYANRRLLEMGGKTAKEILGSHFTDHLHPDEVSKVLDRYNRRIAGEEIEPIFETILKHKNGSDIYAEVSSTLISYQGQSADLTIVRNITARKRAEKLQASLFEISEAAHNSQNLKGLFPAIHKIISALMPVENFYIALYDSTTEIIRFPYHIDKYDETPEPKKLGKGATEYVLKKETPLLASSENIKELIRHGEIEQIGKIPFNWLGVPLKVQEKTIGALVVQSYTEEIKYGETEQNILVFVSAQIATAIERVHAYDELDQRVQERTEELSKERNLSRTVIENSPDLIYVKDTESRFMLANNRVVRSLGATTMDELIGKTDFDFQSRKLSEQYFADERKVISGQPQINKEEPHIDQETNTKRWHLSTKVPFQNDQGEIVGLVGINRDITERKQMEEALRESEQKLADIINFLPDATFVIDKGGKVIAWNHAIEAMTGVESKDILGKGNYEYALPLYGKRRRILIDLVLKRDEKFEKKHYDQLEIQGDTLAAENYLPRLNIYVYGKASPLYDSKCNVIGAILTIRDITDRKRAEERLKKLNQQKTALIDLGQKLTSSIQLDENDILQLIYQNASELMDTDNMYIALYDKVSDEVRFPLAFHGGEPIKIAARKAGKECIKEIVGKGKPIFHLTKAEDLEEYDQPRHEDYAPGEMRLPWIGVLMTKGKNVLGVIATYHLTREHMYSKDDLEILETMANLTAIALENVRLYSEMEQRIKERTKTLEETNRRLEEANRRIAEKQDILTRIMIATDFVHHLNNLAGTIPIWVDLVREKVAQENPQISLITDYLDNIANDINKLLRAAERIKTPYRESSIDIAFSLRSMLRQVRIQYNHEIQAEQLQIEGAIQDKLHTVWGVSSTLTNAIYNVISNGLDAILLKSSGRLTVNANNYTDSTGAKWVKIEIKDTGKGIPRKDIDKIFTTFFTTKGEGKGYGLWRTKAVIENLGGNISINSKEGTGTIFTILLPKAKAQKEA